MTKLLTLSFISVLLAGIFGYFLSVQSLVPAAIAGLLWSALFVLRAFLVSDQRITAGVILLETAAMLFWLFNLANWLVVAAIGGLMALALFFGYQRGAQGIANAFKIRFFSLGRPVVTQAMTAVALAVTLVSLPAFNLQDPKSARQFFDKTLESAQAFLPAQIQDLSPSARAQINQQLFDTTVGRLLVLPKPFQKLIIIGIAILVFLSVKSVFWIGQWLVLGLAFVAYEVLRSAQFFTIKLESRSKEIITL